MNDDLVLTWDETLPPSLVPVAAALRAKIRLALPTTSSKLFHGAPVWFLDENPLLGYSESKGQLALLFWSGKSFSTPGLVAKGKHQAAEARFSTVDDVDRSPLASWLVEARNIQWDYKNIRQNQGELKRLA